MKAAFSSIGAMILAIGLAGCASFEAGPGRDRGAEVTRFHLGQPIARAPIAIEPFEPGAGSSLEFRAHADAVARQLAAQGWTVVNTLGQSEQVALVDVRQGSREEFARSPVSVSIGGFSGGWRSGVGGGATFGGGGRSRELVGTMLEVRIKRRSDGTVFWEGRAMSEAPASSPGADPALAVDRLAEALFRDFPGESGRTIRLR